MSFDALETSQESGRPIEVYEFTFDGTTYRYTSSSKSQTISTITYETLSGLKRDRISLGPAFRSRDITVEMPASALIAQAFGGTLPGSRCTLSIKRFHSTDTPTPELRELFFGYVQAVTFERGAGSVASFVVRDQLGSQGFTLPRRGFQSSCDHVLYEPTTCKADDTDPTFRASVLSVASISGKTLTVSSGLSGVYADGFMQAGYVEDIAAGDYRLILTHTGNVLSLMHPFRSQPVLVNVFAGCAHIASVCSSKFSNVVNFGGFPYVPSENPFETGLS
jgi:uncharacterized phage protein (TIGR02218 family)